jgi:hypothetical protein
MSGLGISGLVITIESSFCSIHVGMELFSSQIIGTSIFTLNIPKKYFFPQTMEPYYGALFENI